MALLEKEIKNVSRSPPPLPTPHPLTTLPPTAVCANTTCQHLFWCANTVPTPALVCQHLVCQHLFERANTCLYHKKSVPTLKRIPCGRGARGWAGMTHVVMQGGCECLKCASPCGGQAIWAVDGARRVCRGTGGMHLEAVVRWVASAGRSAAEVSPAVRWLAAPCERTPFFSLRGKKWPDSPLNKLTPCTGGKSQNVTFRVSEDAKTI